VEVNVDFDEQKLTLPANPEMQKLNFLAGDWSVLVKAMTRRGNWMKVDSVSSSIAFHDPNMLMEHISFERVFPMDRSFTFTHNGRTKKYRLLVYNSLGSNHEVFEGDFAEDKLTFELVNIVEEEEQYRFVRFEFSEITETAFILTLLQSRDGENWMPRDRFEYKKIN
jgi:hypothetical protein